MNLWVKGILDISLRKLLTNTCISSFILQTLARQNLLLSAFGKFEHLLRTALFLGWTLRFARLLPHNDLRAASLIKRHLKVLLPQLIVFVSILMLFGFAFFGIFLRLSAELFIVFPWNVIGFKFSDLSPVFDRIFLLFSARGKRFDLFIKGTNYQKLSFTRKIAISDDLFQFLVLLVQPQIFPLMNFRSSHRLLRQYAVFSFNKAIDLRKVSLLQID